MKTTKEQRRKLRNVRDAHYQDPSSLPVWKAYCNLKDETCEGLLADAERAEQLEQALRVARAFHVFCKTRLGAVNQSNVSQHAEHDAEIEAIDAALGETT